MSLAAAVLVRWLHVLAVAVALGGAVVAWATLRADGDTEVAAVYEWLLWGALGVAAMTGVGNLGAFAPAVPAPDTAWGVTFTAKLVAVVGFLALSVARTGALVGVRTGDRGPAGSSGSAVGSSPVLGRLYAATAGYLAALLALAEVLAHG